METNILELNTTDFSKVLHYISVLEKQPDFQSVSLEQIEGVYWLTVKLREDGELYGV